MTIPAPATALPWHTRECNQGPDCWCRIVGCNPVPRGIGDLTRDWVVGSGEVEAQDAAYIVTACNSFPALVDALQGLMPTNLGKLPDTMPDSATLPLDVTFGELRAASAALALALGEQ